MSIRKRVWIPWLITLPFAVLGALLFFGFILLQGFLFEITIRNQTSETLWVTPLCAGNQGGRQNVLPLYEGVMPAARTADFEVAAGCERRWVYDMDDVVFNEILVRDGKGEYRALPVSGSPGNPPRETSFVISNLASLRPASADSVAAGQRRWRGIRALAFLGLAVVFMAAFVLLSVAGLREWRRSAA